MANPIKDEAVKDEDEIARRRDDVIRRMISTPPTPHKVKPDSPPTASPKKRGRPAESKEQSKA